MTNSITQDNVLQQANADNQTVIAARQVILEALKHKGAPTWAGVAAMMQIMVAAAKKDRVPFETVESMLKSIWESQS